MMSSQIFFHVERMGHRKRFTFQDPLRARKFNVYILERDFGLILMKFRKRVRIELHSFSNQSAQNGRVLGVMKLRKPLKRNDLATDFAEIQRVDGVSLKNRSLQILKSFGSSGKSRL